jgi:hypothetical protein
MPSLERRIVTSQTSGRGVQSSSSPMRARCLTILACTIALIVVRPFATCQTQTSSQGNHKDKRRTVMVTSNAALPIITSGDATIVVKYVNTFRYKYSWQVQSANISAPTPPTLIAPSASTGGTLSVSSQTLQQLNAPPAIGTSGTKPTVEQQWQSVLGNVTTVRNNVLMLKQATDALLLAASMEEQCYQDRLHFYFSIVLDEKTAASLKDFAKNNQILFTNASAPSASDSCRRDDSAWPFTKLQDVEKQIYTVQFNTFDMMNIDGFADWKKANSDAYTAVTTLVGTLLTQVQSLESISGTSDVAKAFQAAQTYNNFWRGKLAEIAESETAVDTADAALKGKSNAGELEAASAAAHLNSLLVFTKDLDCSANWYGRGRTDTYTLHSSDLTATPPTDQTSDITVHTCYTPGTVSTGVGMSFLRNQQFGFVAGRDPKDSANIITVIGATTNQQVTPIYGIQYNIAIKDLDNGLGLHGAVGAALGSSSGTSNIELIAGPSISIRRRAFFITPAFQLGRREELLPGFKVGDPQGTLMSAPVHTSWKPGFELTFSFSVAQ